MERHVNSTLTQDLSQTISCPWLLLRPLHSPPFWPVSLPFSSFPLSLNNHFFFAQKSLCPPSISVCQCEHERVINPLLVFALSSDLIEECWRLNFLTKPLQAIINIQIFFLAWRSLLLEECGSLSYKSNFWAHSWRHITWSDTGLNKPLVFECYSKKTPLWRKSCYFKHMQHIFLVLIRF